MMESTSQRQEAGLMMTTEIQGQEHEQEDRISKLPDDILMIILDRIDLLRDAVRTCVLSKRWRHLPGLRSEIVLDVSHFESEETSSDYTLNELAQANAAVVKATTSILAKSQRTINHLSIKFFLRDESIGVIRSVDNAMANREVIRAEFKIIPEKPDRYCSPDDKIINGRRFMTFLGAYPRAFNGLTELCLYCLRLGKFDMPNVLSACRKLEYLSLNSCDAGIGSVLQIEHPQLCELSIYLCACERIELNRLPRLIHLTRRTWMPSHNDRYPLTWPLLQVWDHICDLNEKGINAWHTQMQRAVLKNESDHLNWKSHDDFKHYNLRKLIIEGFEVEEKFTGYIRQVMKAAVNLEVVSLRKSRLCGSCRICPSSMAYPRTEEQKDQIRYKFQIRDPRLLELYLAPDHIFAYIKCGL